MHCRMCQCLCVDNGWKGTGLVEHTANIYMTRTTQFYVKVIAYHMKDAGKLCITICQLTRQHN